MSANAFAQRAGILLEQGRHRDAEREARQALALDPDDADLHLLLASALIGQERFADGSAEAERAIGLDPRSAGGFRLRGVALLGLERPADARRSLEEALTCDPDDARIHGLIAASHNHQKRWREAGAAASAGLALDPECGICLNQRALALTQLGDHAAAGDGLAAALRHDPEDALTHANLGWSLLHQARYREAKLAYREALRLDPSLEHARTGLIEAIKGGNPLYALFLRWFLFVSRIRPGAMFGVLIATVVVRQGIVRLAEAQPSLALPLNLLLGAMVAFILTSWIAIPLFNATLVLHPLGRHALEPAERLQSLGLWLVLGCAAVAGALWLAGVPSAGLVAIIILVLCIPVTKALTPRLTGSSRAMLALLAVGFAGLGGWTWLADQRLRAHEPAVSALVREAGFADLDDFQRIMDRDGKVTLDVELKPRLMAAFATRRELGSALATAIQLLAYAFVAYTWLVNLAVRTRR